MPRRPRKLSQSNIYHVMMRGNERKNIFENDDDKAKFIDIIVEKNKKDNYSLYAYCIMDNHVHLVIENKKEELSRIMKSINTTYAVYYNRNYKRIGHVFQDRFKSEEIKDERHLLAVIRYVHNNPIKANIIKDINEYKWSSYKDYIKNIRKCIDIDFVLNIFANSREAGLKRFMEYSNHITKEEFMDENDIILTKMSDEQANRFINTCLLSYGFEIMDLSSKKKVELREQIIRELKMNKELSLRQIANALGVSKSMVDRVKVS